MLPLHRYRVTVLAVSLALFLSSVWLPVIVVACEMGTMVTARGCGGLSRRSAPSGLSIARIPCQAKYHYIEANSAAYVPAKRAPVEQPLQILAVVPGIPFVAGSLSLFSPRPTKSPPGPRDIPILTSSLLI